MKKACVWGTITLLRRTLFPLSWDAPDCRSSWITTSDKWRRKLSTKTFILLHRLQRPLSSSPRKGNKQEISQKKKEKRHHENNSLESWHQIERWQTLPHLLPDCSISLFACSSAQSHRGTEEKQTSVIKAKAWALVWKQSNRHDMKYTQILDLWEVTDCEKKTALQGWSGGVGWRDGRFKAVINSNSIWN